MKFLRCLMPLVLMLTLAACQDNSKPNSGQGGSTPAPDGSTVGASPSAVVLVLHGAGLKDTAEILTLTNQGTVPTNLTLTVSDSDHLKDLHLSSTQCANVAAGGTCEVTLTARLGATDQQGSLQVTNTRGASVVIPVTIGTPTLSVAGATINNPGASTLTLTNVGIVPVTFTSLSLNAGSSNLSLGSDTCSHNILPNAVCTVSVNATQDSAGTARLMFTGGDYDGGAIGLSVAQPTLSFENFATQTYPNFYLESGAVNQPLYVKNNGPFTIKNLQLSVAGVNNVSVVSDSCSGHNVAPGELSRCEVTYNNLSSAVQSGNIVANGDNLKTTALALTTGNGVSLTAVNPETQNPAAQGLSFLELELQNNLSSGAITGLGMTPSEHMVILNDAQHPNTCGASLAQGGRCTFWLQASSNQSLGQLAQNLQLHYTTYNGDSITKNNPLILSTELYLAGHFQLSSGVPCYTGIDNAGNPIGSGVCNNMTRFDGKHWYQVGLGKFAAWTAHAGDTTTSDPVIRDMLFADGRIYVEGNFPAMNLGGTGSQACASYAAAWNGNSWDNLATNSGTNSSACSAADSRLNGPTSPMGNAYYLPGGPGNFSQIDFLAFDSKDHALFFNNVTALSDGNPLVYRYVVGDSNWTVLATSHNARLAFTNTMVYDPDHDSLYLAGAYNSSQAAGRNVLVWYANQPGTSSSLSWNAFDPFARSGSVLYANSLFQSGNTLYSYYGTIENNSSYVYHFASCTLPLGSGSVCQTHVVADNLENSPAITSLTSLDASGIPLAVGLDANWVDPIVSHFSSSGAATNTLGTDNNNEMVSNSATIGTSQYLVGTFEQLGGASGLACLAQRNASGVISAVAHNAFNDAACTGDLYDYTKNAIFGEVVVPSLHLGVAS